MPSVFHPLHTRSTGKYGHTVALSNIRFMWKRGRVKHVNIFCNDALMEYFL